VVLVPRLPLRLLLKVERVVKSQSIFSRPQLVSVVEGVGLVLVVEQEICSAQEELQLQQLRLGLVDLATLISSAITPNSSNSAKLYNNNPKCSSPSSNKSALATHNWHS